MPHNAVIVFEIPSKYTFQFLSFFKKFEMPVLTRKFTCGSSLCSTHKNGSPVEFHSKYPMKTSTEETFPQTTFKCYNISKPHLIINNSFENYGVFFYLYG